jgi:hypothetical protein
MPTSKSNPLDQLIHRAVSPLGGSDGPYLHHSVQTTLLRRTWNPNYNQNAECKCGHEYHRHFDSYEEMWPIGCKYCECGEFKQTEHTDSGE